MIKLTIWAHDGRHYEVTFLPTGSDVIQYLLEMDFPSTYHIRVNVEP